MNVISKIKNDTFYKDLFITFIGQFIAMLITFILNKIISNIYSVEIFGIYNLTKRFSALISFIMLMAMGIAIPKFIAEAKEKHDKKLLESYLLSAIVIILFVSTALTIILIILKDFFSILIYGDIKYGIYIFPACIYSFSTAIMTYIYSYYRGINDFTKYNMICIIMQFLMLVITLINRHNLYNLYMLWGFCLIIYSLIELINIVSTNKISITNLKEKLYTLKELLIYTIPRVPGEIILFSYSLIPLSIVSNKFGLDQVGFLSAAISINSLITPLFSLVGTILLPLMSKSVVTNSQDNVKRKIKYLGIIYICFSFLSILFIYLFGKYIVVLMFNTEYVKALPLIQITMLSILPNSIYLLLRNPLDGISNKPYNTISLIVSFLIYVILLIVSPSIEICAFSMTLSYTVLGFLSFYFWKKVS